MKKLLLFTVVTLLTLTAAQSQEFRLGVKAGVNVASLGGDSYGVGSLGSRISFHVGGLAEIPIKGRFSVQPELLFSSEGSNYTFTGLDDNLKLDYVRVPVLAKFYVIKGLTAEAGPVFGVLVNAKNDDGDDIKENFKTFDAAFGIGASYRLDMGVFFSLRYNKGLLNVNEEYEDDGLTNDYKNQSNVFQISAGYTF